MMIWIRRVRGMVDDSDSVDGAGASCVGSCFLFFVSPIP